IVVTGLAVKTEALSSEFLAVVRPRLIIVADSDYPVWERASPKLCERLGKCGTPTIYTRWAGAVTIRLHKKKWEISTINPQTGPPASMASRTGEPEHDPQSGEVDPSPD